MRKRYSDDFKEQAMALVRLGKPVPEIAEELGIGTSVLYRWTQDIRLTSQSGSAASPVPPVPPGRDGGSEAEELRRLRKENAHLLLENDI
ncbi:MAG: transposase [Verrucomicrobiota bacterium]